MFSTQDFIFSSPSGVANTIFNVLAYGATGNGVTDDTQAVQAAITAAQTAGSGMVFFPLGTYYVPEGLSITAPIALQGATSVVGSGVTLTTNSTTPIVTAEVGFTARDITFVGSTGAIGQDGIYCNGASVSVNSVFLNNVTFKNLYNGLHLHDSCFYSTADSCNWVGAFTNACVYTEGTNASGWAWTFVNCQFLPTATAYVLNCANVGSLQMAACTLEGQTATVACAYFASAASDIGGMSFSNTVFEAASGLPAVYIVGTSGAPFQDVMFAACIIGGGSAVSDTVASLQLGYIQKLSCVGTIIEGPGRGVLVENSLVNASFDGCIFNCGNVPLAMAANATVNGLAITSPQYAGSYPFLYFTNSTNTSNIRITGQTGSIGSNAAPFQPSSGFCATAFCDVPGFAAGAITITPTSHAWQNQTYAYVTAYVATAGSYTGTTTITPPGVTAATVPNAVAGMAYRIAPGAILTWGVGGAVTTDPTFNGVA